MKIRLFTIPNMLTIANLICGTLAICTLFTTGSFESAYMLIILAGVFDFFDGFIARLLNQSSPIGGELDSLADVVSFGLAPALIMMCLIEGGERLLDNPIWMEWGHYTALIIIAFSALRLAKFNVDVNQSSVFIGLPTPACALFCAALGMLSESGYPIAAEYVAGISVVMALLLVAPVKMFALKFHGFQWSGNEVRYCFIIASIALIATLYLNAVVVIIPLYIAISVVQSIISRNRRDPQMVNRY